MDDIFVSWALPDKPIVDRIVDQLLAAGLPIHEYSRDIRTGEIIPEWINEGIRNARIVLAVVSAESLANHRKWLEAEIPLAVARLDDPGNRLKTFALVRLGEVPIDLVPGQFDPKRVNFFDFNPGDDPGSEERLIEKLVTDLTDALGDDAPLVIPAALFAMTSEEFTRFRAEENDENKISRLEALCRSVGMPPQPGLWDELSKRYGDDPKDFAPYGDGRSLIKVAEDVLGGVNRQRMEEARSKRIHLHWYSRDELTREPPDEPTQHARRKWSQGYSVLIVDAVSALHGEIAHALLRMPKPDIISDGAVICIPPYTRHTGALERLIAESLQSGYSLSDAVFNWRNSELHSLTFDIPTEISLKRWLSQLLFSFKTTPQPYIPNVRAMNNGEPQGAPKFLSMPRGFIS